MKSGTMKVVNIKFPKKQILLKRQILKTDEVYYKFFWSSSNGSNMFTFLFSSSIFIFILCTEALTSLLNHAESQGKITGMRITCACPSVSHLFADDSLFFCKAEPCECEEVMKVVRKYGKVSG